jgi:nitrite reductase (NO-forming)
MIKHISSSLIALGMLAGASAWASAEEMHMHKHGAESGTPEAPLDIVRDPSDLPPPLAGEGPRSMLFSVQN